MCWKAKKMKNIQIKDSWNQLEASTQQWLIDNPGCVLLPRAIVSAILLASHGHDDENQHGEATVSAEDRAFISSLTVPAEPAQGLFDAVQP
ncbi:MAG: hypothetical protein JWO93_2682 [Micrococcaceae bacterium]|jgi:hypothetical protein|nr:hypothetical protein [Micrococcaceae bacterium]